MEDRYTDGVKNAWKFAGEEAAKLGSDYLGTEHLLLGTPTAASCPDTYTCR